MQKWRKASEILPKWVSTDQIFYLQVLLVSSPDPTLSQGEISSQISWASAHFCKCWKHFMPNLLKKCTDTWMHLTNFTVVRKVLCNNYWSHNLIGPYHFFQEIRLCSPNHFSPGGMRELGIRLNYHSVGPANGSMYSGFSDLCNTGQEAESGNLCFLASCGQTTAAFLTNLCSQFMLFGFLCSHPNYLQIGVIPFHLLEQFVQSICALWLLVQSSKLPTNWCNPFPRSWPICAVNSCFLASCAACILLQISVIAFHLRSTHC